MFSIHVSEGSMHEWNAGLGRWIMKAEGKVNSSKVVGIWIRVSTEDQAQSESPEHHEKRARLYAESKGWNIKEVYHLEAVSGKSVIGHAECQRM